MAQLYAKGLFLAITQRVFLNRYNLDKIIDITRYTVRKMPPILSRCRQKNLNDGDP